jgi:hypothetical protein
MSLGGSEGSLSESNDSLGADAEVLDLVNKFIDDIKRSEENEVNELVDELLEDDPADTTHINTAVKQLLQDVIDADKPAQAKLTQAQKLRQLQEEKRAAQAQARATAQAKMQETRQLALEKAAQAAQTKQEALAKAKENALAKAAKAKEAALAKAAKAKEDALAKAAKAAKAKEDALAKAAKAKEDAAVKAAQAKEAQQAKLKVLAESKLTTQTRTAVMQKLKLEQDLKVIDISLENGPTHAEEKTLTAQKVRLERLLTAKLAELDKLALQAVALIGEERTRGLANQIIPAVEREFEQAMEKQLEKQIKPLLLQAFNLDKQKAALAGKNSPALDKQEDVLNGKLKKATIPALALMGDQKVTEKANELLDQIRQEMEAKAKKPAPKGAVLKK